jgi:hypothetical protein
MTDEKTLDFGSGFAMRDHLACAALQGMLASPRGRPTQGEMVRYAYELADAMLEERKKPVSKPVRIAHLVDLQRGFPLTHSLCGLPIEVSEQAVADPAFATCVACKKNLRG